MLELGWKIHWHRGRTAVLWSLALTWAHASAAEISLAPANMPRIGSVNERFQSYNIEMVEVTGGPFWKPYGMPASDSHPELFSERKPKDLGNARLRSLAAALSPAFMRVSGTWANATYFAESDDASPTPPAGFKAVLTRRQWQGVVDFSRAADAPIVTSFAISAGTRDAAGVWMPEQAGELLAATRSMGGRIAAVELMNEPDFAAIAGAPERYDAAAYARDFAVFSRSMKQEAPTVMILGPGTSGGPSDAAPFVAAASGADAISYHYYGAVSARCGGQQTPEAALSEAWLSRTDQALASYRTLRDRFAAGKPIWLTETAETACGGNPWSATFLDTFRYLDQLGRLAKAGVQVVMHNTLAASDYGLLDERTFLPRPNYWAALLWRRLMGTTVLDSGVPIKIGLHVYAHCQHGSAGGVTLLVINNDRKHAQTLTLPDASERYTLDAATLQDQAVRLNGRMLSLENGNQLPRLTGVKMATGPITLAPASITFLTAPEAGNRACR